MQISNGIYDLPIDDTPIAILDFETTGTRPGRDRVIEVSVVRVEPDGSSSLVLDSLINPNRRVSATEIHGITDDDVADAPRFSDVAGSLLNAISGCVLAAYNVYFDLRFLEDELERIGISIEAPYFCLMYLRPMLGLGKRCTLKDACKEHGIERDTWHATAHDTQASASLYDVYRGVMTDRQLRTFRDLASLRNYKFVESFSLPMPGSDLAASFPRSGVFKSRSLRAMPADPARESRREYWDVLKTTLADLQITDEELDYAISKRAEIDLAHDEVRMLHARAFANVIVQFIEDCKIDEREASKLRRLHQCLHQLGWAPGD